MSYGDLEIYNLAHEIVLEIHKMTVLQLPKFELYEEGSQIRRSSKSVKSNIVEGYGRRKYKQEFMRFLTYAIASNDETSDHLRNLYETGSLKDEEIYTKIDCKINLLGKKINSYLRSVENTHLSPK
jgi:four helix bundle protein